MLISLTVGKIDAGVAVLLTQDNRLIEFPSVLLPSNIAPGSIVDITVSRNQSAEEANAAAFHSLQKRILNTYGIKTPSPPVLRLRNATQTSLVLEWDPIDLATASLKSLSLYRNGSKAGSIPRPLETRSTKISGLAIHTEYSFHLVLRTTAGTYQSEKLKCRTHKMTDLSGITVTVGIMHPALRDALAAALDRIGGKLIDTVRIDTTHFVCTEGRGPLWEKAVDMNIPVVRPEWVSACEAEGTLVSVRGYYLNADPKTRQLGPGQSQHQQTLSGASAATASSHKGPQAQPRPERRAPPRSPTEGGKKTDGGGAQKSDRDWGDGSVSSPPPPPPVPKDDINETRGTVESESHGDEPNKEAEESPEETTAATTEPSAEKKDREAESPEKPEEKEKEKEAEEKEEKEEEIAEQARNRRNNEKQKNGNGNGNGNKQREGEAELSEVPL